MTPAGRPVPGGVAQVVALRLSSRGFAEVPTTPCVPVGKAELQCYARGSMKKLSCIQVARGVAVLLVLALHLYSYELRFLPAPGLLGDWVIFGNSGVDLFFILSGFIIVRTTSETSSPMEFLLRRATRIYPLYWLVTLLFLGAAILAPGALDQERLARTDLVRALLLLPQSAEPPLIVAWTLVHEIYFYAVFACFLCLPRMLLPCLLAIWALVVAVAPTGGSPSPAVKVALSPLTLEFIGGCALAWSITLSSSWPARLGRYLVIAPLLPLASWALYWVQFGAALPNEWQRCLYWGLPWLAVLAIAAGAEERLRGAKLLERVGDASYSIYLLHCLIIGAVYRLMVAVLGSNAVFLPYAALVVALLLAVGGGMVSYRLVERPMLTSLRRLRAFPQGSSLSEFRPGSALRSDSRPAHP